MKNNTSKSVHLHRLAVGAEAAEDGRVQLSAVVAGPRLDDHLQLPLLHSHLRRLPLLPHAWRQF